MLKRLKISLFGGGLPAATLSPAIERPSATMTGGFQPVKTTDELLSSEYRLRCLRQIAQTCSMPAALYDTLCTRPFCALLLRVQQVPAAAHGPWARQGGFGDLTLQYTACAVRLAKGAMFPPGAAPEEQSAQSAVWQAVVFWSTLFHHLPLLARLEGEQLNGEPWLPGMTVPEKAYRFRFRKSEPAGADACSQASMMAVQLLPAEAVSWLSATPAALRNLAGALWNGHPEMPLLREILKQAAEKVEAPSMTAGAAGSLVSTIQPATPAAISVPAMPPEPPDISAAEILPNELASPIASGGEPVTSAVESLNTKSNDSGEIPPTSDKTEDSSDETDMLLSLFPMMPEEDVPPPEEKELSAESAEKQPVSAVADSASPEDRDPAVEDIDIREENSEQSAKVLAGSAEINDAENLLHQAEEAVPDVIPAASVTGREKKLSDGEAFFAWLKLGLRSGQVPVNGLQDKVHIVAGHVFLPVPGIFFEYMKQTGKEVSEREQIQREFEQLNICKRRNNRRYWFAHQLQDEQGENGFKRKKGYLVKGRQIFGLVPQDSPYLSFP
ncbi:TraI domain-containing protein [Klebsiella aerogenes]